MILTLGTALITGLSILTVLMAFYICIPAWKIRKYGSMKSEERYEAQKLFYMISGFTIIILSIRLLIFPIYFFTLEELVPMLEGAMCWYGVLNGNNPYGFISFILKLFVPFVYLYWIVFDISNKKCKTEPMIGDLSKLYIVIFPLLLFESIVDIIFFSGLNPIKVTCCVSAYISGVIGLCPFCYFLKNSFFDFIGLILLGFSAAFMTYFILLRMHIKDNDTRVCISRVTDYLKIFIILFLMLGLLMVIYQRLI
jgi:hypothetical protein